jgi:hypothetical protein
MNSHLQKPVDPATHHRSGDPDCGILCFSTSKFDDMSRFFAAIGFVVTAGRNQLLPIFSPGRAARVRRGNFEFNLEEDTSKTCAAAFNMMLVDLSDEEIERAKSSGFGFTHEQAFGESYTFKSPDGGTFTIH